MVFKLCQIALLAMTLSVSLTCATSCLAEPWTHQPPVNGSKNNRLWRDVVGETVAVEGMALGWHEKIRHPYIVLNGEKVFITREQFRAEDQGKLVRVVGKLRIDAPYFVIDVQEWRALERVSWPWMKVVDAASKQSTIEEN